jgi:hypothetical protein
MKKIKKWNEIFTTMVAPVRARIIEEVSGNQLLYQVSGSRIYKVIKLAICVLHQRERWENLSDVVVCRVSHLQHLESFHTRANVDNSWFIRACTRVFICSLSHNYTGGWLQCSRSVTCLHFLIFFRFTRFFVLWFIQIFIKYRTREKIGCRYLINSRDRVFVWK